MNWVLPNPLPQGTNVHGLETCRTSCRPTCCVPLWSWYVETATCCLWSPSTTAPTVCWPAAGTGSASRSGTGLTPSLPAASSPAWTPRRRQRSPAGVDDPLGCPKRSPSAGRPWSCRRHTWLYRRRLQHHHCFPLCWLLRGCQHHLGWGLELFFLPSARGFLYSQPLPGAAAIHIDGGAATRPAAAGQARPVASSGGAVWRRTGHMAVYTAKYKRRREGLRPTTIRPPIKRQ
jgi:hypothetical protein